MSFDQCEFFRTIFPEGLFGESEFLRESEFSFGTVVLSIPSLMMGIVCTPKSLNKWPL